MSHQSTSKRKNSFEMSRYPKKLRMPIDEEKKQSTRHKHSHRDHKSDFEPKRRKLEPCSDTESSIASEESSDGEERLTMVRPTLIRQLQTILNKYPDNSQILRELVQNAEDAGAKCIKIWYDHRPVDPGGTSSIRKYFKSPGICVYNDATFSNDDWDGIRTIYSSIKENEPLKVGKFGLGFKSVFHMTDNPVIVSGEKLLVIDPKKSEEKEEECLSFKLNKLARKHRPHTTMACIFDKFGFNDSVLERGLYPGTLFWFPLRQIPSKLCSTVYTEKRVNSLFRSFIKEGGYNLLFLNSLDLIVISYAKNDKPDYTIEIKGMKQREYTQTRKKFRDDITESDRTKHSRSIITTSDAVIKTNHSEDHYVIARSLRGVDFLSENMRTLVGDEELGYSPFTGIAFCTASSNAERPSGQIFCFLPLPITEKSLTGLPVHVNGLFDLEDNRRHLKLPAANDESEKFDKALLWNIGLIKEVLPETYCLLVRFLREKCKQNNNQSKFVEDFYRSIPDPEQVESVWDSLITNLYTKLLGEAIFYTKQNHGKWVEKSESLFAVYEHDMDDGIKSTIETFLLQTGDNVVNLPPHMSGVLEYMKNPLNPVTPNQIRQKLKESSAWKKYSENKKHNLLTFIIRDGEYKDLCGIELLPLNDKRFVSFSNDSSASKIYIMRDDSSKLFPGLEGYFISKSEVTIDVWHCLNDMAEKGICQLRILANEFMPELLKKTLEVNCEIENGVHIPRPSSGLEFQWISDVWKHIMASRDVHFEIFHSVPLIPLRLQATQKTKIKHSLKPNMEKQRSHRSAAGAEESSIGFLPLKGNYMFSKHDNEQLWKELRKILPLMGTRVLSRELITFSHIDIIEGYIKTPSPKNVFVCFENKSLSTPIENISMVINSSCNDQERSALFDFLNSHRTFIPEAAKELLRRLKIVQQSDNVNGNEMVSVNENKFSLAFNEFPKDLLFPRKYVLPRYSPLAKCIGASEVSEQDCLINTINIMCSRDIRYTVDDKRKFMLYLAKREWVSESVLTKAKEIVFMPSTDGKIYKVKELFNSSSKFLLCLFFGQQGMFPDEDFLKRYNFSKLFLEGLGIKTKNDISYVDMLTIAKSLHENRFSKNKLYDKANAFLAYMKEFPEKIDKQTLGQLQGYKWIQGHTERPDAYPSTLVWYSENVTTLYSPKEIKLLKFKNLVGSVTPLIDERKSTAQIAQYYGWNDTPTQNLVIKHYGNVICTYNRVENLKYVSLSKDIWTYFHGLCNDEKMHVETVRKLQCLESIPIKHGGFKPVCKVVCEYGRHVDFNLKPYLFELSSDVTAYLHTFIKLGLKRDVGFDELKFILQQMSELHEKGENSVQQIPQDRRMVVNILSCITSLDRSQIELKELLVPIASSKTEQRIHFRAVKECTYTSGKFSNMFPIQSTNDSTTKDSISYVHHEINHLAKQLGVPSAKKRFMFNQPWGQSEKLTSRINNLLSSYTDGFAVFKELIQNADDAGATKVSILYDERHNKDCRDGLFDDGMAECQGQALWFFNNAVFKDSDFENLIKLGAKSKLTEKGKIGKFGLGFCAVYNLTDMPSIISRDKLVILDPHTHHLGDEWVDESNPGIIVPLTTDYIKAFPKQFKPYSNIFDCNLLDKSFKEYNGSLFRFPLRTRQQALESEIYSLEYTKREVKELLLKLYECASDLLLFTQNITALSVYHLHPKSTQPNVDKKLLFQICKANKGRNENRYYLKEVTSAMTACHAPKIQFPIQVIDINMEVHKQAESLSTAFKQSKYSCTWVLAWSTGSKSYEIAKTLDKDGAIPIGAVAVPVKWVKGKPESFRNISKLPMGFSSIGRIFCFLPLPIDTELPFHVNGCFMVEADRKSIVRWSRDDKYTMTAEWNNTMFEDIIKDACINLLETIASQVCNSQMKYWELWPKVKKTLNQDTDLLIRSLYTTILNTDHAVFYRIENNKKVVKSMCKSTFLCPAFRNSGENGQSAYNYLLYLEKCNSLADDFFLMDMPTSVYDNFRRADEKNLHKIRLISKISFFSKYFFPQYSSEYWRKYDLLDERDNLLMEAFDNEELHYLIENTPCIPVKGSRYTSVLRKPSDLVSETGSVSKMFSVEDARFPALKFSKYGNILLKMQMMDEQILSLLLIDRANSVQTMLIEKAKARSKAIIQYLNKKVENHYEILHQLKTIHFLPVMDRPLDWPLPWKGDQKRKTLMSPAILFASGDKDLIGSVGFVLDPLNDSIEERVLNKIGIQQVTIEKCIEQLVVIGETNLTSASGLENICDRLYIKLNEFLQNKSESFKRSSSFDCLWDKRIIKVGNTMMEPCKVAMNLRGNCQPYLFAMHEDLQRYNHFWSCIKIPKYFDIRTFTNILVSLRQQKRTTKLSERDTGGIINVLGNLCYALNQEKRHLTEQERSGIFVPDRSCVLRCIDNVCYDEKDFPFIDNNVYIIHDEITERIKIDMGILSKRHLFLKRNAYAMPFGQREKLVTRLSGILRDYPKDYSILNELLQNADDAGATEIHFILDLRQLTKQFFDTKCKYLPSGPALCVFNNACFSNTDLDGIQDLGECSKLSDSTKTGKFGVGFNAVYHLTDVPAFITRGQTTPDGGSFCVFDPHCWYLPNATAEKPGMRMKIDFLKSKYRNIYSGFLQDVLPAETGTWFRFPLRKQESKISSNTMDETDIKELLEHMKEQLKRSLLFLSCTRKISISYIEKNTKRLSNTFSVSLSMSSNDKRSFENFSLHVKQQSNLLRTNAKRIDQLKYTEVQYIAKIIDNFGKCDTWLLSRTFGFEDTNDIPPILVNAFQDDRLSFLPRGGVAAQIDLNKEYSEIIKNPCHNDNSQAFCFLPLPIQTGFPCHINGNFSVHSNRSMIFEGVDENDLRFIWNRLLLQHVIAHSYASCLDYARKILSTIKTTNKTRLDIFFSLFPNYSTLEGSLWKRLARAVFMSICSRKLEIFPIFPEYTDSKETSTPWKEMKIKWTSLTSHNHNFSACFDDLDLKSKDENMLQDDDSIESQMMTQEGLNTSVIRHVLVELGMKLVCTPIWIYNSMSESFQKIDGVSIEKIHEQRCYNVKKVTPELVMTFLKSFNSEENDSCLIRAINVPIESTLFQTIQRLECVLKYCLQESTADDIDLIDLPLLVDNAGNLVALNNDEKLILSKFCNLLPASRARFVHKELVRHLWKFSELFEILSLQKFVELLTYTLESPDFRQPGPIDYSEIQVHLPYEDWIKDLWKYLNTQTTIIPELCDWCLFPALWYNKEIKLISFNLCHTVMYCESFDKRLEIDNIMLEVLRKLSLPSPSPNNKYSQHLTKLVASKNQTIKFAKCLVYHKTYIAEKHTLLPDDCNMILDFLKGNIETDHWKELRSVPLFTTIDERIVHLDGVDRVLVLNTDNNSVPLQGINEMTTVLNTVLVKYYRNHETIYNKLNFIACLSKQDDHPLTEFYVTFLLEYFDHLPRDAHIHHLQFIRDKLLQSGVNRLEDKLKTLRFIPQRETSILKTANEFFSPHNSVFRCLCTDSELPPSPFDDVQWKKFMNVAGIEQNVKKEQFISFARRIESRGLNDNSVSQCKELLKHLMMRSDFQNDTNFLQHIRDIKFIEPFTVEKRYAKIYPQLTQDNLIAFSGSITERHAQLAWTTDSILPQFAVPNLSNCKEELHIKTAPTTDSLVVHIQNMCVSLQKGALKKELQFIKNLMKAIYEYLANVQDENPNEIMDKLADIPIVHISDPGFFLKAKNVVLKEHKKKEIRPYLMIGPEKYGEYFELFRRLGATDEVNLDQYFRVLENIKAETKNSALHYGELECTENAVRGILTLLLNLAPGGEVEVTEPLCYLLGESKILYPSHDLVFADDKNLKERLKNYPHITFLASMDQFTDEDFDVTRCLEMLPLKYQPQKLSVVVKEELQTDENKMNWEVARTLERFLSGDIFTHCVTRLINSDTKAEKHNNQHTIEAIVKSLRSLGITALCSVRTILVHGQSRINTSTAEKKLYYSKAENKVYVSLNEFDTVTWVAKNLPHIASVIHRICLGQIDMKFLLAVISNYNSTLDEMTVLLDDMGVLPEEFKHVDNSWIPAPGTPVPQDCLQFLVQNLVHFAEGDYAVYEVFDNLFESDSQSEEDKAAMFVYVKIVKCLSEDDEQFPLYRVDVGEGQTIEVRSILLYQIIRPSSSDNDNEYTNTAAQLEPYTGTERIPEEKDKDQIFQEVEEALIDAWKISPDDCKRVYKRLLLRWHPDKNNDSKLCNEVTKHIINFFKRLQSGQINTSGIPSYSDRRRQYGYKQNWKKYRNQWNTFTRSHPSTSRDNAYDFNAEEFAERVRRQNAYTNRSYHDYEYRPDPQPQVAKVWLRQAQNDLTAARSLMKVATEESFNWVCVASHQAAEKALKAVQIMKDANKAGKHHSLLTSVTENDSILQQAVRDLETRVGDYTRMRYPRPCYFPKTPSDLYKRDDAKETIRLAEIIVQRTRMMIN